MSVSTKQDDSRVGPPKVDDRGALERPKGDRTRRLIDIAVSAVALILLFPLMLAIATIVAGTSPGGPLFRQTRVGRGGRPFTLLKFRSMTIRSGSERGSFDAGSDVRVTGFGRILRRSKLDELPQLWNVLVGDMSLVGPRPEVTKWTRVHTDRWDRVLAVRPGLTDPASLAFRNEEQLLAASEDPESEYRDVILPRKLQISEHYVRNRSLGTDFGVVLRTFATVLTGRTGTCDPETRESDS